MKVLRYMVNIRKESDYKIDWLDVEHQIYDEDKTTTYTVTIFGIRVWQRKITTIVKHQILKNNKKVGFITD